MKNARNYLISVLTVCCLSSCYVLKQGYSLLSEREKAKDFSTVRAETSDQGLLEFLDLADGIRAFGTASLGLKAGDNYRTYLSLDRNWMALVVSASQPLKFDNYTWSFPFVGTVPYLGFFDEGEAKAEARRLKELGYDVWVRGVDAFSTLGVLRDPLVSFMRSYKPWQLANLILHEETHATLWIPGDVDFNEQLANFVGSEGSREWIVARYGGDSSELKSMNAEAHDRARAIEDLSRLRAELESVYTLSESDAQKRAKKEEAIKQFQENFASSYGERYQEDGWKGLSSVAINNAYLQLFNIYDGRTSLFERAFTSSGGTIKQFLDDLREQLKSKSPVQALEYLASR